MNRIEFDDRISYVRKELAGLEAVQTGCMGCSRYSDGVCKQHGPVPADFIPTGCDQWDYQDTPF